MLQEIKQLLLSSQQKDIESLSKFSAWLKHYVRILVLCFLFAVAFYYIGAINTCNSVDGELNGTAHLLPKCIAKLNHSAHLYDTAHIKIYHTSAQIAPRGDLTNVIS